MWGWDLCPLGTEMPSPTRVNPVQPLRAGSHRVTFPPEDLWDMQHCPVFTNGLLFFCFFFLLYNSTKVIFKPQTQNPVIKPLLPTAECSSCIQSKHFGKFIMLLENKRELMALQNYSKLLATLLLDIFTGNKILYSSSSWKKNTRDLENVFTVKGNTVQNTISK